MSNDSTTASAPVQPDWTVIWSRYVRSNLKGPQFAAVEGVDYDQLRWHVAHEHWRADRRAFRNNVYDLVMAESADGEAVRLLGRRKSAPPAGPGDELSAAACALRTTKLSAIECN